MKAPPDDFFVHGRLGEIALGSSHEHVIEQLGLPEDILASRRATKHPTIYHYGTVDITIGPKIVAQDVILIAVYFRSHRAWHHRIDASDWPFTPETPLSDFAKICEARGFGMAPDLPYTFGDQQSFFVGSARVGVLFENGLFDRFVIASPRGYES